MFGRLSINEKKFVFQAVKIIPLFFVSLLSKDIDINLLFCFRGSEEFRNRGFEGVGDFSFDFPTENFEMRLKALSSLVPLKLILEYF